jgi:hypothetical protein
MARDYENLHDLDDPSDDELRGLVREHLRAHNGIDVENIGVRVEDGVVRLTGRVGTEAELRVAEHVVTDVLGIREVRNELLVDPLRRAESPEAIDEHLADEERHEGLLLGDREMPFDREDELHREDLDARLFGSTDVQKVIEEGTPWIPPESPTPEGMSGTDATGPEYTEDH